MKRRNLILFISPLVAVGVGALSSCAPQPAESARPQLPLDEFMGHVMERNAEQLWAWTTEEIDAKGTHSGKPATEKDWEDAKSDSLTVAELTYALEGSVAEKQEGLEWRSHIARLHSAARASADAAEKHDYAALQKASNAVNAACVSCHWRFAPALEVVPKYPGD